MSVPDLLAAAVGAAAGLAVDPAFDAVVEVVVTGPARSETRAGLVWRDGRLVDTVEGAPGHPEVTFTIAADDARQLREGAMAPTVAFMRGRLKTAGDPGLVLALLAAAEGQPYDRWVAASATGPQT